MPEPPRTWNIRSPVVRPSRTDTMTYCESGVQAGEMMAAVPPSQSTGRGAFGNVDAGGWKLKSEVL